MTKAISNTDKEKLDKKFKEAQAYLTTNGFKRSIKTLFEDMEKCEEMRNYWWENGGKNSGSYSLCITGK